jgi:hypothetical protein
MFLFEYGDETAVCLDRDGRLAASDGADSKFALALAVRDQPLFAPAQKGQLELSKGSDPS